MGTQGKILVVSFQSLTATSGQGMARLGYLLSKELHRRDLLKSFVVHSKGKFDTPFPSEPVSFFSRYYLFILNKLNHIFKFKAHQFRFLQERLFDWLCAKKIDNSIGIVFATHPYLKRTFRKAKRLGIKTILLSGTPEDNYMYDIVSEENKKLGTTQIDAYTYDKRNNYYNSSLQYLDIVIGFFPTAYKTYAVSRVFKGENINMTAHMTPDLPAFDIKNRKSTSGKFVVGYLAYTVVLKGLHYLLEAWEELLKENDIREIELIIGGPMHPTVDEYVKKHFHNLDNVQFAGQVTDIAGFMQQLDLFAVPSLIDGGPMTALEAAHYAVPVLITDNAGSSELIGRGNGGGYIVPIRDAQAIKEKILWAYRHRDENTVIGINAKENMNNYSFESFIMQAGDYLEKQLNGQ